MEYLNGMTVKELKKLLKGWPEEDQYGDDSEVWLTTAPNRSSQVVLAENLNDSDLLLGPKEDHEWIGGS